MNLHEYPRPANDTGIGLHWVAGYASAIGMGKIRDFWIPELKALGVKWVKIYNHDGAIDFAELLLAEGIMPIVRLYQPTPNPTRLGVKEIVHLEALIRAGVRYFEFNHEPDKDSAWRSGRVPPDGLDLVVENAIANLETILERGGMPAIPAVSNGSRWDIVGRIVRKGRKDLFDGPVWQAVHNYSLNRPLDYPYDIGNQEGAAYTQRFYQAVANEEWGENAWRGRSLTEVNRLRRGRSNPGATLAEDHACWLAYEYMDGLNRRHLGRSIPILSTESGYIVGEDQDPRYPATTPDLHMAQTLEACRIMMGTSTRFKPAPDYYFCTAFWLIANAKLGSSSTWWEGHAWYSDRWPGGLLPVVHALRAEPKQVRRWQDAGEVGARVKLHGMVLHAGDARTVILEQGGRELKRADLDASGRYHFDDLLPGRYTVRVDTGQAAGGAVAGLPGVAQLVDLDPGAEATVVNFDLSQPDEGASNATIFGQVRGGAGAIVMLLRASDGEEWVTLARDDGGFRFVDLPAGVYSVRIHPHGSRVDELTLNGDNELAIELTVDGWGHTVEMIPLDPPGAPGAVRCQVQGMDGIPVRAQRGEWESDRVHSGSAPHLGPHMCEIGPLEPGRYLIVADDLPGEGGMAVRREAAVRVEKKRIPLVHFVYNEPAEIEDVSQSIIQGRVVGGFRPGDRLRVALIDENGNRTEVEVDAEGAFAFEELPAGLYSVEIVGHEDVASRADIALDGVNTVTVELLLPLAEPQAAAQAGSGRSAIVGYAPGAAGRLARLVDTVGNEYTRVVDETDQFHIDSLPAGVYTLTVEGGYEQGDLAVDGEQGVEVIFSPLIPIWETESSAAGSMPGFSSLRVEVEGKRNWPVRIWQEDGEDRTKRTGDSLAQDGSLGDYAVEFKPLKPGRYMVQPDEVDAVATVDLTGLDAVWISFKRRFEPVSPHLVRPLARKRAHEPSQEGGVFSAINSAYYLFIGSGALKTEYLTEVLDNVIQYRVPYGSDAALARLARRVLVVGDVSDEEWQQLTAAGAEVARLDQAR